LHYHANNDIAFGKDPEQLSSLVNHADSTHILLGHELRGFLDRCRRLNRVRLTISNDVPD
jgi:hypothetical protein